MNESYCYALSRLETSEPQAFETLKDQILSKMHQSANVALNSSDPTLIYRAQGAHNELSKLLDELHTYSKHISIRR